MKTLEQIRTIAPLPKCGPGTVFAYARAAFIDGEVSPLVVTLERWRGMSDRNEAIAEAAFYSLAEWARGTGRKVCAERNAGAGSVGILDTVTIE